MNNLYIPGNYNHRLTQDAIKKHIQNNPSDSYILNPKDILTQNDINMRYYFSL